MKILLLIGVEVIVSTHTLRKRRATRFKFLVLYGVRDCTEQK
jgi:hypothetical protein